MWGIVSCDDGHGGCIDAILSVDFGGRTAREELYRDHFEENLTEDFAEEHARDAFFEHLEARVDAVFIDIGVVFCILHDVELQSELH